MSLVSQIVAGFERVAEQINGTWVGATYTGNLDSAPLGYRSFVGADVTNEPAGYSNGLVFTGKNEDDTGRVQIAYSTSGDYGIRWRLGGSWSSWSLYTDLDNPVFTTGITTPALKVTTGAGAAKILVSDADGDLTYVDRTEGLQWWQTFTLHAVGVGQQDMGIWIPWDCTITKIRHRCATAGTGGSPLVELRKNGITGSETVSGTSFAPATSPSWNTVSINLSADDLLWSYMTAINTTTVGAQIKTELLLVRR